MNRVFITLLLSLFVLFSANAVNKNDIVMVSYEQSWLDDVGTLALKNNTNEEIRNIVFLIKYLDMSGNELDYEEFSDFVSIAPGMTKKLNIPAYEHRRNYHYYKTKDEYGHPAFKIEFKLKDYNVPENEFEDSELNDDLYSSYSNYKSLYEQESSSDNTGLFLVLAIIVVIFVIGISVGLYVLVAVMAQRRHRNVVLWVLLSIVASPILIIIILLAIGEDYNQIDRDKYDKE